MLEFLCATRDTYVLADRPGDAPSDVNRKWSIRIGGLHQDHLRDAVNRLRQQHLPRTDKPSKKRSLKPTALLDSLAKALGAKSYDHWLTIEQPKIIALLNEHGMTRPVDLIKWATPAFTPLAAQQVADRLFNSGMDIPQRIFTGVGSPLFAASSYGRLDIDTLAGKYFVNDQQRYNFCEQYSDQVVLRAEHMSKKSALGYLDLTGRMLMLNAVREYVDGMFNLLGSNLMQPSTGEPVMRVYNTTQSDREWDLCLFQLFRAEIESSSAGWVEVIPVPGNVNLIFLKGQNGAFDWVIRDQRDKVLSTNSLHPFFVQGEIPTAMDQGKLLGHLYYSTAIWRERLEHDAESRHYANGGTAANWPGYQALIERELVAAQGFQMPRQPSGRVHGDFFAHRINERCLMVSPLITIAEFQAFSSRTNWGSLRAEKAHLAHFDHFDDLEALNSCDPDELPIALTWLDAVAYCRDFEKHSGLPVRLLTIEEWRQITPPPSINFRAINTVRSFTVKSGERPNDPIYEQMGWGVVGSDGELGTNSSDVERVDGVMRFGASLNWVINSEGLPFLSTAGFAEWLADHRHQQAPAGCTATHQSIRGGGVERALCPVHSSMSYKGAKVGFRLCYVANADA